MLTETVQCMHPTDILNFLRDIKDHVRSIDELLAAIRGENQRAETYGQTHIPELMEVSAYQWQLEQLEMKLKAPSLIKISFEPEGAKLPVSPLKSLEEEAEALLLEIVMRMISKGDLEKETDGRRFRLIL